MPTFHLFSFLVEFGRMVDIRNISIIFTKDFTCLSKIQKATRNVDNKYNSLMKGGVQDTFRKLEILRNLKAFLGVYHC